METSEELKDKAKSISDNTFGKKIINKSNGYINGAIAGGVIGIFCAAIFKQRYLVCGGVGILLGGYIGFRLAEESNKRIEFTNVAKII